MCIDVVICMYLHKLISTCIYIYTIVWQMANDDLWNNISPFLCYTHLVNIPLHAPCCFTQRRGFSFLWRYCFPYFLFCNIFSFFFVLFLQHRFAYPEVSMSQVILRVGRNGVPLLYVKQVGTTLTFLVFSCRRVSK